MGVETWHGEKTERLQTLYREGLSFRLIAADIGVTRSAAIAKAHRLKLPKRSAINEHKLVGAASGPPRRRRPSVPRAPVLTPASIERMLPERDYSCTINELRNCSCRYPLWGMNDPHELRRYCGRPTANLAAGRPYCRRHTPAREPVNV